LSKILKNLLILIIGDNWSPTSSTDPYQLFTNWCPSGSYFASDRQTGTDWCCINEHCGGLLTCSNDNPECPNGTACNGTNCILIPPSCDKDNDCPNGFFCDSKNCKVKPILKRGQTLYMSMTGSKCPNNIFSDQNSCKNYCGADCNFESNFISPNGDQYADVSDGQNLILSGCYDKNHKSYVYVSEEDCQKQCGQHCDVKVIYQSPVSSGTNKDFNDKNFPHQTSRLGIF
jgi:hypothetical protein